MATIPHASAAGSGLPSATIVIASHNEGANLERTLRSLAASHLPNSEILVVDDGSTDGSTRDLDRHFPVTVLHPSERLGSARARNFGAAHARGDALIFCDAHISVPADWMGALLALLHSAAVGAVGPVVVEAGQPNCKGFGAEWSDAALTWGWLPQRGSSAYPVPMLGAFCLALRRSVFASLGGFDSGIVVWGSEDAELCLRLWTHGYSCLLEPSIEVSHVFRPAHPYAVPWQTVFYNQLRLIISHFERERAERVIRKLGGSSEFAAAYAEVKRSDVWQRRAAMRRTRTRDAEWFCQHFHMDW
ncbi:MAG: glycosyltransferase family 2 protein [Chloroflexi bacterium]|nr:glycosyltransferase family 2 protein [Chloroflexota bacterium]